MFRPSLWPGWKDPPTDHFPYVHLLPPDDGPHTGVVSQYSDDKQCIVVVWCTKQAAVHTIPQMFWNALPVYLRVHTTFPSDLSIFVTQHLHTSVMLASLQSAYHNRFLRPSVRPSSYTKQFKNVRGDYH
jgi:hypothetical protein